MRQAGMGGMGKEDDSRGKFVEVAAESISCGDRIRAGHRM